MALSADGTTALIGAEGAGSGAGAAYIFHVSNEGSWATSSAPTATLTSSGGYFGSSVVLSADGTTALIGALGASSAKGAAYVFHVSGSASSPPATFAGSYRFSYRYYNNGAVVSAGNEAIGFGTDGHWTMSACTDTGTYSYDRLTDTVAFTDTTDSARGLPSYTWVGRPSTGFTGLMASTAGGSYTDERGTAVATPSPPSSCSVPTSPGAAKEAPRVAQYPAGVGPAAGNGAQPEELTVGPDGNLWYTDEVSEVFRFSPTTLVPLACSSASPTVGNLGCEVSADPVAPNDIVAAPDGAMWFTQSAGGNPKGGASYFPASIGRITPTGSYSSYPVPASASSVPGLDAITVGPNGNLWFTEPAVGRIGEVTPRAAGPVVHEFALPAADRLAQGVGSPVTSAGTIAAGLGGDIWFTEQGSNAIGVMATSGALLHKFTVPNPNSNPAPLGITEGPDKTMWFTENGANQVASITAQGKVTLYALPAAADGPESIVYGPDGNFWFTDNTGAARIDPSTGKVTLYRAHAASLGPAGVTVGPDCTSVWFTEPGADRLGRVSPVPNTTGCKAGAVPVP
jgi:streptogramin lyase